jgi:hypothetical protein
MANLNFAAQVADWCHRVEGATEAIFKESSQELAVEVQKPRSEGGRMRVDTGFLRASLLASTSAMPAIVRGSGPADGATYAPDFGQIEAVIAGSEIGDTIYIGFTAGYAGAREYGARGQAPDAFVRTAAQRWGSIVDAKAAELKSKLGL